MDFNMFYKILLSAVTVIALTATTACGQCASGGCGDGIADYGGGCGCDTGAVVGQDYFSADAGCGCGSGSRGEAYTRLYGGVNFLDTQGIDFQTGWGAGLALGRRSGNRRFEVELSYRDNDFDDNPFDGGVSQVSNMYNVLFDIDRLNFLGAQFYAGGGIGLTYARASVLGTSLSDTDFSYQAIAGLSKQLRNGAKGFVEYRYLTSEFDFPGGDFDFNNHDIFFGVELNR